MPLLEWDDDERPLDVQHHPFTGALDGHEDLIETDPGRC